MRAVIKSGFVWLQACAHSEMEAVNKVLTVEVPGHEHMPLFKRGDWDGFKHYFEWKPRRFRRGLLGLVQRNTGLKIEILETDVDAAVVPPVPLLEVDGKKFGEGREYQPGTLVALLAARGGIAHLATNAGKTAVIAGIAAACHVVGKSVTILENRVDLALQVRKELEVWSGLRVGLWSGQGKKIEDVMVVMVPAITPALNRINREEGRAWDWRIIERLRATAVWVVDECHHVNTESYERVLDLNREAWRYGFSGTVPEETSCEGLEVRAMLGDVLSVVSNAELIAAGISAKPTIRLVEYEVDGLENKAKDFGQKIKGTCMKSVFVGEGMGDNGKPMKYMFSVPVYTTKMREFVMNYSLRHDFAFWDLVKKLLDRHGVAPAVVLVDWVEFATDLAKHIGAEVLHGKLSKMERARVLEGFKEGRINRVVATSVLDEGISIDRIRVLLLANAGSSIRQFLQRIGRGLRKKVEDNTLTVYCFVQYGHKYLIEPSKKRIALWKAEGFDVVFDEDV